MAVILTGRLRLFYVIFFCSLLSRALSCGSGGSSSSSSSSGDSSHVPHYTSGSQNTNLYNSVVATCEKVWRNLDSFGGGSPIYHTGVKITLESGSSWLVHKGANYGIASQTVVTPASNMGSSWSYGGRFYASSGVRVTDLVAVGGGTYSLTSDNCWHATNRMINVCRGL